MEGLIIQLEDANEVTARAVLRSYVEDLVSRYRGRALTPVEVDTALRSFPSDGLIPPRGFMWIARLDGGAVGCVGLRLLDDRTGEVARLFVAEHCRRRGIARLLMHALEEHSRMLGLQRLRLHTRSDLIEARRLYGAIGYEEVQPFNDNPYVDHWLERDLLNRS